MQVPSLARRHRVITYDGPGNGRSDRATDPARYSAESYAADAVAVLDACAVERAVVGGLSLGAPVWNTPPPRGSRHRRELPAALSPGSPGLGKVQPRLLARPLPGLRRVLLRP